MWQCLLTKCLRKPYENLTKRFVHKFRRTLRIFPSADLDPTPRQGMLMACSKSYPGYTLECMVCSRSYPGYLLERMVCSSLYPVFSGAYNVFQIISRVY